MNETYKGTTSNRNITPYVDVETVYEEKMIKLSLRLDHRYSSGATFNGSGAISVLVTFRDGNPETKEITLSKIVTGAPITIPIYVAMSETEAIPCRISVEGSFSTTDTPLSDESGVGRNDVSFDSMSISFSYGIFAHDPVFSVKSVGYGSDTVIVVKNSYKNATYRVNAQLTRIEIKRFDVSNISGEAEIPIPLITEAEAASVITDSTYVELSVLVQISIADWDALDWLENVIYTKLYFSDDVKPQINCKALPIYPSDSIVPTDPTDLQDLYIQGFCSAKVKYNASAKYGATIQSITAKVDGKSVPLTEGATEGEFTTELLKLAKGYIVDIEATDSRGLKSVESITIECLQYNPPRIGAKIGESEVIVHRCDEYGNLDDTGRFIKIVARSVYSPLNAENEANIQIRYYVTGESAGTWQNTGLSIVEGIIASGNEMISFDEMEKYTVELSCPDKINTTFENSTVVFYVPSAKVFTHKSKKYNSFCFGGIVTEYNTVSVAEGMKFKAEHGINSCYLHSCIIADGSITLRTAFATFENSSPATIQVFRIFAASADSSAITSIVDGVLAVTSSGKTMWRGTDNVSATASNGNVTLAFNEGIYSNLIVISNKKFNEVKNNEL